MSKSEELGLGGTCGLQLTSPKNTVQELKTERIGRRDTAGDGEIFLFLETNKMYLVLYNTIDGELTFSYILIIYIIRIESFDFHKLWLICLMSVVIGSQFDMSCVETNYSF